MGIEKIRITNLLEMRYDYLSARNILNNWRKANGIKDEIEDFNDADLRSLIIYLKNETSGTDRAIAAIERMILSPESNAPAAEDHHEIIADNSSNENYNNENYNNNYNNENNSSNEDYNNNENNNFSNEEINNDNAVAEEGAVDEYHEEIQDNADESQEAAPENQEATPENHDGGSKKKKKNKK